MTTQTKISPGRTYKGASNEARRAERRQKLIEAAVKVYGAVGYHGATVRAICAEAGLTERYFYESFEKGEALLAAAYLAVMERLSGEVMTAIAALPAPIEMGTLVRTALHTYYTLLRENPNEARVFLVEILGVSPAVDTIYWDTIRNVSLAILRFAPGAVTRLSDQGLDLDLFADGLIGAVVQIALGWVRSGYAQPVETVVETAMAILGAVSGRFLNC
ncbi:TetR/AcrR family transcriptional regulator [Zavarzinia compransoris]|uniref:TetR/AcrR family transcriptional regulator n=1 Tax=Zavarzinia compransoris TaxID=1264899 RepID=A0A317E644_9PROT|nr:TetR/AcrR family transcriptional regulator [Zavarzinia compransoris]PWR20853.1 TetR/AcrR family transcriptional regulator [Zavarzinia compransoris]TDP44311.1 TetR family transcriptional regulator [Zavarzinia compransoris]